MMSSPHKLTATQVLELLKNNTLTVEAYARSLLDRIQARDSTVKAWAYFGKPTPCSSCWPVNRAEMCADFTSDPEFVLSQARDLDQIPNAQRGPLHGVAIGIKDVMNTKGTTHYQCHVRSLG